MWCSLCHSSLNLYRTQDLHIGKHLSVSSFISDWQRTYIWLPFAGCTKMLAEGYCNMDWGGQKHHHSISSFSFHVGMGVISWNSRKQHFVVLSSTEAEDVRQTQAAKEVLWLWIFLSELCVACGELLTINCYNQGAITLSKDNKFHV